MNSDVKRVLSRMDYWKYSKQFAINDFRDLSNPGIIFKSPSSFESEILKLKKIDILLINQQLQMPKRLNGNTFIKTDEFVKLLKLSELNPWSNNLLENYKIFNKIYAQCQTMLADFKSEININVKQLRILLVDKGYPLALIESLSKETYDSMINELLVIEKTSPISDVMEYINSFNLINEMKINLENRIMLDKL